MNWISIFQKVFYYFILFFRKKSFFIYCTNYGNFQKFYEMRTGRKVSPVTSGVTVPDVTSKMRAL